MTSERLLRQEYANQLMRGVLVELIVKRGTVVPESEQVPAMCTYSCQLGHHKNFMRCLFGTCRYIG
jgi:hypothetical protein